ncbi:MICAL-like protein 1 isoform X1 [Takifugu flavidus]|uniref:MICAL-like protein 1 isoform X1 n=1 Tax=Takifugu flavidus TaxID=433684 RepID=UPI00254469CB|nr:MICAL-like protein 1 isoform X1 [Takifugu flavidus]
MMGSLKALQEWCRIQCEDYNDVHIKDMSRSFRDGLAFCAIIHRFRPELIDFASLSKENVYENNHLAFDVAETQLGIPALLDPEDMVSMKVPDRLSIITYVSQYYNFFNNKSHANPPSMKRINSATLNEPAQKRTPTPFEDEVAASEPSQPAETPGDVGPSAKRSSLSSTCAACHKHVHLVQRFLADGKLYHRSCFRCTECHSTLLPGSYKLESSSGVLVCTHHVTKHTSANHNGRPDLSKGPPAVQSARIGRSTVPRASLSDREPEVVPSDGQPDNVKPANDSVSVPVVSPNEAEPAEKDGEGNGEKEETPRSTSPPNPFDESDEGEQEEDNSTANCPPSTPVDEQQGMARPVPAPRRASEPTPPPRPAPRVRLLRPADGENQKPPTPPKPRERSQSPGSLSSGTHKPKDPPWLALVQSEHKKKKAPAPPPAGQAAVPNTGSPPSLKGGGSRPSTPPSPANPFDGDEDEGEESSTVEEERGEGASIPATAVAGHPWYSITQAAEATGADAPPSAGSSSRSASPGGAKSKKRPAPRAPQPPAVLPHSEPSSCSPSPALSTDSLSSSSDHSSSQLLQCGRASGDQPPVFTKSVSEPSICSPSDPTSSSEHLPRTPLYPPPMSSSATSAPATPQTGRSSGAAAPSVAPSPLASGGTQSHIKRTCKENPFNRKASPSPSKSNKRPPKGSRPARPPAPGHGFPLIKRRVQSDQYIPAEDIYGEMTQLEQLLDELEQRGVELEKKLRDNPNDEDEEHLLVDWFTLIHEKHLLVRREAELVYTAKQQNLEERQADVEYELRCLLNKPEKDWTEEDKSRDQELMAELVTIIEQRNQIVNNMDQDRQREEEEDKLIGAMLKKKEFHKDPHGEQSQKKKVAKFKPIKVLKRLSHKGEPGKSPDKDKTP